MSTNTGKKTFLQALKEAPQNMITYISGAVSRIFGPRDDNYPNTGVQPFDGERPKEKHY